LAQADSSPLLILGKKEGSSLILYCFWISFLCCSWLKQPK